eukprot:TRINITY_DN1289_c0_g1_i6.p1 TRINITY_DN1289_c0_g1~~TRINITY_DN1289_c0_g1_i6.p1  ORF type:complete len:436 (+),score=153.11 TRINITY_DN1289_c0_g1_i6:322-1629(+)
MFTIKSFFGNAVVLGTPKLAYEVMQKRNQEFVNHPSVASINDAMGVKDMLTILRDDEWRNRRSMLKHSFYWKSVKEMIPLMENKIESLIQAVDRNPEGERVDMYELFSKFTLDIIGITAFGTDFGTLQEEETELGLMAKKIQTIFQDNPYIGFIMMLPKWHKLPIKSIQSWIKSLHRLKEIISEVVEMRKKDPELVQHDLLQCLIDAKDSNNTPLTPSQIQDNSFLFLLAGQDTTATSLSYLFYELGKNPDCVEKILEEAEEVLGDRYASPDENNVKDLHYLDACFKESLRLHPAATLTNRDNNEDVEIGGYTFPAKTQFIIPIYAFHHSEEYFENPEQFNPDRFMSHKSIDDEESEVQKTYVENHSYLPFGNGPRMCIGMRFAALEVKLTALSLLQKFKFKYEDKDKVEVVGFGSLRPKNGINLCVYKNKENEN